MLVIRRKNLVIGLLVVLLVITGYLNFMYNQNSLSTIKPEETSQPNRSVDGDVSVIDVDETSPEEAVPAGSSSFFRDYRFEREHTRKTEVDYINTIIDNPKSSGEIIREAQSQLLEITSSMEAEMVIESLIKSKGFKDVVVIIHKNNISVIVDKPHLEPEEVAQILEVVKTQSGERTENIRIIPKL